MHSAGSKHQIQSDELYPYNSVKYYQNAKSSALMLAKTSSWTGSMLGNINLNGTLPTKGKRDY